MTHSPVVPEEHVIVIFGANGDLARRKLLPALFHLEEEGLLPNAYRVIGTARTAMTTEAFREFARASVEEFCRCEIHDSSWARFSESLSYIPHEFRPGNTRDLDDAVSKAEADLGGEPSRLLYLAVPPAAFLDITAGLRESHLTERANVVYEKPFGVDLESFHELNALVNDVLQESQVYRIDHFLGKETVQNILALRFANGMFEPVWNRQHIDHVQIDCAEEPGIGGRASFYERTGALKDMVVTHLFQVLGFVAMEPPIAIEAKPLIDEKVKVFESMMPLDPGHLVRGQYEGYRDEPGVAPDSDTESFVAARFEIDNWRWADIPFYLRTGKRMAESRQSVTLAFKRPPQQLFRNAPADWFTRNHLTLDLAPDEGISISFLAKVPGPRIRLGSAEMRFDYSESFGSELIEAYERLIHDALIGDRTLFTRPDGIERTWELLAEVLDRPPAVRPYAPGSWGPREADDLIAPRHWHNPHRREEP